jgi:hypothetical protein
MVKTRRSTNSLLKYHALFLALPDDGRHAQINAKLLTYQLFFVSVDKLLVPLALV